MATESPLSSGKNQGKYCLIKKPKRPLSAYNLFFQHHRKKILSERPDRPEGKPRGSHGKIGFASLARTIAARWNNIDPIERDHFEDLAVLEKAKYKKQMEHWKKNSESLRNWCGNSNNLCLPGSSNQNITKSLRADVTTDVENNNSLQQMNNGIVLFTSGLNSVRERDNSGLSRLAATLDEECTSFLLEYFL